MDEEDELAVVGREEEPLAAPLGAAEPPSLERVGGGSNVFSVAMCAGPPSRSETADDRPSSWRRQASISGSSGMHRTVGVRRPVAATVTSSSRLLHGEPQRDPRIQLATEAAENRSVVDERIRLRQPRVPRRLLHVQGSPASEEPGFDRVVHGVRVSDEEILVDRIRRDP